MIDPFPPFVKPEKFAILRAMGILGGQIMLDVYYVLYLILFDSSDRRYKHAKVKIRKILLFHQKYWGAQGEVTFNLL